MAQPTALDPGVTDVLDLLETHDGMRIPGSSRWVDVTRSGQPAGTARVDITDEDGRVTRYRVRVEPEPA